MRNEDCAKALSLAVRFATRAHASQIRKDGELFIHHPIRVSEMVAEHGGQSDTVIAAVLHDVIEDTPHTSAEISGLFGARVDQLLRSCTNSPELEQMSSKERKLAQAEKYSKEEPDVQLIKLADQTDNLECLIKAIAVKNRKWVKNYAAGALAVAEACRKASEPLYERARKAYQAVEAALQDPGGPAP